MRSCSFLLAAAIGAPALAAPLTCPPDLEASLAKINALRARSQLCGGRTVPAAAPLRWDARLAASARHYVEELRRRDLLSHEGQDLPRLRDRLRAAGYPFRAGGENLAAGAETVDDALEQWRDSPGHCENLMQPNFRDVGLACAIAPPGAHYASYWVLHLGRSHGD